MQYKVYTELIFFSKLGPKMVGENGQLDKEFEQLSSRVRKIYSAVLDGDVSKAKEELPAHYRYHTEVRVVFNSIIHIHKRSFNKFFHIQRNSL